MKLNLLKNNCLALIPVIMLLFQANQAISQEISKDVYVVRPYEPSLSDASKYNFLPETDEFTPTPPRFNYSINPVRLENSFAPEPIKAAKTTTTSLPKIYKSWIKIGLGNYSTPLAEFNISNLRSKDYSFGAGFYHKSSNGKIILPNDDKVPAGYMMNKLNLYGKRFFSSATLSGDLKLDQNAFYYNGYNTDVFTNPDVNIDKDSTKQRTYLIGVDMKLGSTNTDSSRINYKVSASFDYFMDKSDFRETSFVIKSTLNKSFNGLLGGLDLSLETSRLSGSSDSVSNTLFRFHPWISKRSDDWKFDLGFEAVSDMSDISHFYLYPRASLDIIVVENVLVPFIGLSGELQKNNYSHVYNENHFIKPGTSLKNTSSNLIAYGGLKGNISDVVRFRADVSYSVIKNAHFFVIDTLGWQNQFNAVYDDIDLITYHGQITVQPSDKLEVMIDGKYFDYETFKEKRPWQRPRLKCSLDAAYKVNTRLTTTAGVEIIGDRWIKNNTLPDGEERIRTVADINLKINYQYSKVLGFFADFYNLADRSYMVWSQYPSQRFNFVLGLSYKL